MDMSLDEYHQTNTFEPVGVVECIEHWNDDSKVKTASPKVEAGGIDACNFTSLGTPDACNFTSLMLGTPDVPICPTAVGSSNGIPEEERKGCVVTNDSGFPVFWKSACPLAVSEADLSKCRASTEGNCSSVENNGNADEKSVQDDDGNFIACKLTPPVNVYEADYSKCLGSVEGNISGVGNDCGASDKAANDSGFPVSCKSVFPLTVSEADLSKCRASTEGNGGSVESNDNAEEKSVQVDGDFTACKFTPLVNIHESDDSKFLGSVEGKVSGGENDRGASDKAANDSGFPVSCKSVFPLTVSEADLSKCRASTEGNGASVESNDNAEEKSVQVDRDFTACKFTPLVNVHEFDDSKFLGSVEGKVSGGENDRGASDKAANDSGFPVSCKSAYPLTVSRAGLSKCRASTEGNGASVESNDNAEEKSVQDDDGDFTACKLTPLVNVYEADDSKCLGSVEGKVSGVENDRGASDKAAKNSQSRERKKSKYLCYPFVNHGNHSRGLASMWGSEIDDAKSPENISIQHDSGSSLVKSSKRRRERRKSVTDYAKLEKITVASAELLKQLRLVALDHSNPRYNRAIDPTELFFNGFRATVFRGLSDSEVMGEQEEVGEDEGVADFHAHVGKTRKEKGKKGSDKKPPFGLYNVNVDFASIDSQMDSPASDNMKPQRKRKSKEVTTSGTNQTVGEPGKKKRIRKKGTAPGIPCINGNNVKPISLEVCLQDAGPYAVADTTGLNADVANSTGLCANGTNPKMPAQAPAVQTPEKVKTATGVNTPDKSSAEFSLDQMKQSLELMTSMLEKSSTTVSPETRAKLENEIKNLLKKVNPMVNPSF